MASNMDTVGTFEMAKELGKVRLSCDCSKSFILLTSWLIGVWFYEIKCFLALVVKNRTWCVCFSEFIVYSDAQTLYGRSLERFCE